MSIKYTNKAPNPLEYSTDTGQAMGPNDFKVIAKDVPCQNACPAKTNVPEYIRLIKEGKYEEAHLINQEENVLPGVLGRICTHPCEDDCRHQWTNTQGPVRICSLKRAAADLKAGRSKPLPAYFEVSGKTVAVIGAGPAGLAAARELKRYGHAVTIYEKQPYAGGQVRMGVPQFRLPHEILNEDIQAILDSGIKIVYDHTIDCYKVVDMQAEFDAVLLATGANDPRSLKLEELPDGVGIEGLNFMKRYNDGQPIEIEGDDIVIIGGGFTAIDCARSARRLTPQASVTIMYRRGQAQMAATEEEFSEMESEHITIQTHVSPVSGKVVNGKLQSVTFVHNRLGEPDDSGKPSFTTIEGSQFSVPCQTLIFAIGQSPDTTILPDGIEHTKGQTTTEAGLFVAGDFAMGNGDVIHAVADGKEAAEKIDCYLTGQVRRKTQVQIDQAEETGRIREYDLLEPVHMHVLPTEMRDPIKEVELGFNSEQAELHAKRCYFCNYKFEIDQDKCIHCDWCIKVAPRECILRLKTLSYDPETNAAKFEEVDASKPEDATYIWIDSDQCIRCGNCYGICPVDAITLRKADRCKGSC